MEFHVDHNIFLYSLCCVSLLFDTLEHFIASSAIQCPCERSSLTNNEVQTIWVLECDFQ